MFNNLVCALQCFLCLFCARFALLKTGHSNRNLTKKGLKIESFLQKTQKFFCVFFLRLPSKVTNFNTSPMPPPPFWKLFLLDTLNSEQKPPVKKPVNRQWFWNLPVESRKSWPVPSLIQMAIFYKELQKSSSDWAKPPAVIRLSYTSLLCMTTRQYCELEKTRFFCRNRSRKNNFSELALE